LDLERAIKSELETGRLGVPVAMRIHATLPMTAPGMWGVPAFFRPLLSLMGDLRSGQVQAKQHASAKECTVLWTEDSGKSVFLTLATSAKLKQSLHVLLFGNHGMTQLHGGEAWSDSVTLESPFLWEREIQESLKKGTSIPVKAS
jgi:hypothetical protein